jgi:hypothetical protein
VKGLAGPMLGVMRPKLACGVFGGSPENCRVPWLLHKAEHDGLLVWPQNQHRAGTLWRPSHEWDWRGGCTEFAGFAVVHHKTVRGHLVEPQNQDQRLGGRRWDPGAPRSFEAGDTRHDRGVCVGRMRRPDGCATVRWRTSCVDQNSPVRVCIVSPTVGAHRSFPKGLYIGGGG